jgi:hypothetical protein
VSALTAAARPVADLGRRRAGVGGEVLQDVPLIEMV